MDAVEKTLHMVSGLGEKSYPKNSQIQERAISRTKHMMEDAITEIYINITPKKMVVADMGCSSGSNILLMMSEVIDIIGSSCSQLGRPPPELLFLLNDLPGNDFNTIFQSLASENTMVKEKEGERFVPYFVAGVPGSFYGRVFPCHSIDFVYSSFSLHWLSQVPRGLESNIGGPLHKKNIYIATTTPSVIKLYSEQYARDFTAFLQSRSAEINSGGRMLLTFLCRKCSDPASAEICTFLSLFAEALNAMVSEGFIIETTRDNFQMPIYMPSLNEVKSVIQREGSFYLKEVEIFESNWDPFDVSDENNVADSVISGENVAKHFRAVIEPILASHFGGVIMDKLFSRFAKNVAKHLRREKTKYVVMSISLKLTG